MLRTIWGPCRVELWPPVLILTQVLWGEDLALGWDCLGLSLTCPRVSNPTAGLNRWHLVTPETQPTS